METLILTFFILLLTIGGLAVGVFVGRGPIKGSCGQLACFSCAGCKTKHMKDSK